MFETQSEQMESCGAAVVFGVDRHGNLLRELSSGAVPAAFTPNQWLRIEQSGRHCNCLPRREHGGQRRATAYHGVSTADSGGQLPTTA